MNKTALIILLTIGSFAYADGEIVAAAQKKNNKSKESANQNKQPCIVTLTSARPESDNGWYLFADALYWHVDVGSTDWANGMDNSQSAKSTAHNHSLNFKWDWGFRAGVGINMDHDKWDSNLYYTWLFADASNRIGGANITSVLDQIGIGQNGSLTTGKIKWDVHFSMFDWELGRWHYVSKNLALRPHVGVKGGWINQKIHSNYSTPNTVTLGPNLTVQGLVFDEKFQNDFWGVGPSAGLNTMWVLGNAGKAMDHRFSLFGDFGGALMYGHFHVTDKQNVASGNGTEVLGFNQKGLSRNLATAMLQGILGLSWDTSFNNGKNHFMMKIGYELQYWFRQNQLVTVLSGGGNGGLATINRRASDDLSLQGATAELRFDF